MISAWIDLERLTWLCVDLACYCTRFVSLFEIIWICLFGGNYSAWLLCKFVNLLLLLCDSSEFVSFMSHDLICRMYQLNVWDVDFFFLFFIMIHLICNPSLSVQYRYRSITSPCNLIIHHSKTCYLLTCLWICHTWCTCSVFVMIVSVIFSQNRKLILLVVLQIITLLCQFFL